MPRLRRLLTAALLSLLALVTTACSVSRTPLGNPEAPYPPAAPPRIGEILHLPTGIPVSDAQMLAAVTDARIVYVGETHDNPAAHRVQLTVLKAMAERWPGEVSLGMEMFTRAQQPFLDRWVAGELSERDFLKLSGWHSTWSIDFALYRDLLNFARDQRIPVVGLNAAKSQVRAVSRQESDAAEQSDLPEMDLDDPYHTALVESIYRGHMAGENRLAGFQRVQTLWDETMAESVVNHLNAFPGERQRMVVLAGGNHIRYGFGIPRRVFRRLPTSYALVGSQEIEVAPGVEARQMKVRLPEFPMPPYDYLVHVAYEALPGERVKLGVRMEERENRVVIAGVVPGSSADLAGVKDGDLVLALDGDPIEDSLDLVYAIEQKRKGDQGLFIVERDGEKLSLTVDFQPLPAHGSMPK